VSVTGGNPISILMQNPVMQDVNKYPISIASARSAFMKAMKNNIENLYSQNLEKDAIIRDLEKQLK
jgi:hypothetical protein